MREYIISILAASVLSGISSIASPQKQRKYVSIISGLVILCVIVAPFKKIDFDKLLISFEMPQITNEIQYGEEYRSEMIKNEITDRINSDIEERVRNEFGKDIQAYADIGVNDEGKITGVKAIMIKGSVSEKIRARLCEVYGVEKIIMGQDCKD